MRQQLVPPELLAKSDKILFVTHLAIGDFTYLQNCFYAFSQQYPHIKIHLWVDEVRKTRCFWRWKHLKKYALYDWLKNCSYIDKVYNKTYSPAAAKLSLKNAQQEQYPIVISLATLRPAYYAKLARSISPQAFIIGMTEKTSFFNVVKRLAFKKLDAVIQKSPADGARHISQIYAWWFWQLFNMILQDEQRFPFVDIPQQWNLVAKLHFLKWGIDKKTKQFSKVIFINPYAKTKKRSWPLSNVAELIKAIKQHDLWGDVSFVINVVPEHRSTAQAFFKKHSLTNTFLTSADHNFFQLPATMSLCDVIVSVETSTMHLANAVHVPVIALMRQKTPEWSPIDTKNSVIITTAKRNEWVCDISVSCVLQVFDTMPHILQKKPAAKNVL